MVSEPSSSPPRPAPMWRSSGLRNFIPLAEEALSTRGQRLPALIQNRSSTNLDELRGLKRRMTRSNQDEELGYGGVDSRDGSIDDWKRGRTNSGSTRGRLSSLVADVMMNPQMRMALKIVAQQPDADKDGAYREQYYKTEEELTKMKKPVRQYYERNNYLISQYLYIDRLLDSSLPHNLIQEYNHIQVPDPISEESSSSSTENLHQNGSGSGHTKAATKVKRTPKDLYHIPKEDTPLLDENAHDGPRASDIEAYDEGDLHSGDRIVTVAIYINIAANALLLCGKIAVIVLTSSLSVLASLVDAALDFLSTAIIWTTTKLISRQDRYAYPVGRSRLEPIGVLVFSVIMITSFAQVALQCLNRLTSGDTNVVELGIPSIAIMASTVLIKFGCWLWCRLIKNSSVQALAQDAMTDVVFNTFSIIFPIIGYYLRLWPLDALGGLFLSLYVIISWSTTTFRHIRNLTGFTSTADERNILLYLTMRFAKTIHQIQSLQAYHVGDKLNVEVDIVLDESMTLRDSHDLGESLQYVLESVPTVERAFVHLDYDAWNLKSHMAQA
ncbi:MAG: hypothetical protein MMC33_000766 [Icmadophila ericetorum]|nr:hypothetical protein [Icmadophila ericetorum]